MVSRRLRITATVLITLLIILSLTAALERKKIARFMLVQSLFSGADQVQNFRTIAHTFPVHVIAAPAQANPFEPGTELPLPTSYVFDGKTRNTAEFLDQTDTTGLLIVQDGRIVYENYWRGNDVNTHWISFSLNKSFISALVGIAVSEGAIKSIDDPVTLYVPELKDSAYDGVHIKDILQMSSGASWNEDYSDWNSDINRFGRAFAFGGSFDEFVHTLKREHAPGTFNRYNSMDTQVLGLLLRRVTKRPVADYLSEKIWTPLGMESGAEWMTDDAGSEFAAGGLNATLRDYAKLGELYAIRATGTAVRLSMRTGSTHRLRPTHRICSPDYAKTPIQHLATACNGGYQTVAATLPALASTTSSSTSVPIAILSSPKLQRTITMGPATVSRAIMKKSTSLCFTPLKLLRHKVKRLSTKSQFLWLIQRNLFLMFLAAGFDCASISCPAAHYLWR